MEKYEFNYGVEYLLRHERGINPNGKSIQGVKPEVTETSYKYNFEDVNTFLSALDVTKSKLYQNQKFLFRGHQDSEWELIPSVFRNLNLDENKNERLLLKSGNGNHLPELNELRDFLIGINQLGLHIDDESFDFINSYNSTKFHLLDYDLFPKKQQLKELALAHIMA